MIHPLKLYGDGLQDRGEVAQQRPRLRLLDGTLAPLPLGRYLGPADAVDHQLLVGIDGPVLDIGCGPGRHLHALAAKGVFALGVDLSPVAVQLATGRGANAIVGSVFGELPGTGTWRSALLLDGNVGIGGAPGRLFMRVAALLEDGGRLLVELGPPNLATTSTLARIETEAGRSGWFRWAWLSIADIEALACATGFTDCEKRVIEGRWFATLTVKRDVSVEPRPREGVGSSALRVEV